MNPQDNVTECYNKTATQYAEKFFDELNTKHLDRILLKAFADENKDKGTMIDLGCGPGQTTAYLNTQGVIDIVGTDLSPEMIVKARELSPVIKFEVADMLALQYANETFGSATAFYAIVHFNKIQLQTALNEIYRVLKRGGQLLFSFHIGDNVVTHKTFLGADVNITFYFWKVALVIDMAKQTGFATIDIIERQPYADSEYPSTRAYLWLNKP